MASRLRENLAGAGLVVGLSLLSLLLFVPAATADFVVGAPGTGAGQYDEPEGIAVDTSNGRLYVADSGNDRIDVFAEDGAFLFAFGWGVNASNPEDKPQICDTASGCLAGVPGSHGGQFKSPETVAVDSSSHAVYVGEARLGNNRVQKFDSAGNFVWAVGGEVDTATHANLCTVAADCGAAVEAKKEAGKEEGRFFDAAQLPLAVGPGGVLHVADSRSIDGSEGFNFRIQRFEPSGAHLGPQLLLPDPITKVRVDGLAVDSGGALYVTNPGSSSAWKFDAGGTPVTSWGQDGQVNPATGGLNGKLTVGPGDSLFLGHLLVGNVPEILEFDSTGAKVKALFPAGLSRETFGLAYYPGPSGDLFAVDLHSVLRLELPDPGPLVVPGSLKADPLGNVRATLKVTFNAEGKASKAHFEYITKEEYEAAGDSFGAGTRTTADSAPTVADFENHTVEVPIVCPASAPTGPGCLKPETPYYLRAVVSNADGTVTTEKVEFTTLPPLRIEATWATEVGADTARLHAEVNPLGLPSSGRFEYVEDASFQSEGGFASPHTKTTSTLDFGTGEAALVRSTQLYPLQPGTTYHYRLRAEDPYFPAALSAERTFTTPLPGEPGGDGCANAAFRVGPAAALPDCRAYELVTPLDKSNGDIITRLTVTGYPTFLHQSSTTGSAFTYSSYRSFADPQTGAYTAQYLAARHERGQAGEGWQSENIVPPRGQKFRDEPDNPYQAFSADLSSGWMLQNGEPTLDPCAPAGFADLYHRDEAGAFRALSCAQPGPGSQPTKYFPELQGFSDDGSRAVFRIDDSLASSPPASGGTNYQVYESTGAGVLRLVSVLPNGEASPLRSSAGTALSQDEEVNHNRFNSVTGAVSADGTRVFWSTGSGAGPIYLRINSDQAQSKVEGGECVQPIKACTLPVSATVSKDPAFFQVGNPEGTSALFTIEAGPLKGNLYRFDAEADPPASELIAAGTLQGAKVLGASRDLSRVYYASQAATPAQQAEGAIAGEPNVYLAEEEGTRFVAALSSGDLIGPNWNPYGQPTARNLTTHTAEASPDGRSLVFMSNNAALSERTGYDNTDALSGKADSEVYLYDATAVGGEGKLRCVSCNPSGARPRGRELQGYLGNFPGQNGWAAAAVPRPSTQHFQPRYVSEDGSRVYFNSLDALVLADTNGMADVYQWEAGGSGSCEAESPAYVARSEGCLSLISSGQSPFDSELLDISPSGDDVFFTTAEGLVSQDYGLVDVYDARVGGGFPSPPGPVAGCEGEACQGPSRPPDDPTPSSLAFAGAGNVQEPPRARCPKGKARRRGRCVNRKNHRSAKPGSRRRTADDHRRAGR